MGGRLGGRGRRGKGQTEIQKPKPKNLKINNLKNVLQEGFDYSVAASLKISVESGDKPYPRSSA